MVHNGRRNAEACLEKSWPARDINQRFEHHSPSSLSMQYPNPSFANNTHFSSFANDATTMPSQAMPLWDPLLGDPWLYEAPISIPPFPPQDYHAPVYGWSSLSLSPPNNPLFLIDPVTTPNPVGSLMVNDSHNPGMHQSHRSAPLPNALTPARKRHKRRHLNEQQRFRNMQNDPYIMAFTATEVYCAGCETTIQLDRRKDARFYANFWLRHRSRCSGVKHGMTAARRCEEEGINVYTRLRKWLEGQ